MPRDIPLGNGRLLINFDSQYHLRDLHYPRVGGENHTSGHRFRFGIWLDGDFGWVHGDDWQRSLDYQDDTLATDVKLRCDRLGVEIDCTDVVDFHETIYLRRVTVRNLKPNPRGARCFFSHDFHIADFDLGDTAYYHPSLRALIHYKGPRYFLINALTPAGEGISDFATGYKEMVGKEGTWRDAEDDGSLGKNPIAQGSVDSTCAVHFDLPAGGEFIFHYWICVGESYHEVSKQNQIVLDKTPESLIRRTAAYWRLWTNKDEFEFDDLPLEVVRLYKRSLLIIRTNIDDGGAIIAANDTDITQFNRDTYSYMWPRDGALVAHALDIAGYDDLSAQFYNFCLPLLTGYGYFLHKYNPDGSAGSSWHPWLRNGDYSVPIQEDETALVVWALWKHFDKFRDVEVIKPLYRDLIVKACSFLASYIDETTDLPNPCYDLWEERWGVHAWTVGAVYGGLMAGANFARAFGEEEDAARFQQAAERIKWGADKHLYRKDLDRFVRMVNFGPDGSIQVDKTLDCSIAGLMQFGMYDATDPRTVQTARALYDRLWVKTSVGGMARYENDYYHQVSKDISNVAGNPWFICTLWIAQFFIARAENEDDLKRALEPLMWVVSHALRSGILAEQVDPYTDAPISVSPLTWSHATFVGTVVEYLDKKSELRCCPTCGQPLFTKEREKLRSDRAHKAIRKAEDPLAIKPS